jgi:Cdc6-like AAA superfamily ATPase
MTSVKSQPTQPQLNASLVNGGRNASIQFNISKAIKAIEFFTPKTSIRPMLPYLACATVLYYDKITETMPNKLKDINVPLPENFKSSLSELNDSMKNASPLIRQALFENFKAFIDNAHVPFIQSRDFINDNPSSSFSLAILGLIKAAPIVSPQVKPFKVMNDIINSIFLLMMPAAFVFLITEPLRNIAENIASISPKEIVEANKKATKLKLQGDGFKPLESKIWDDAQIKEYKNKPLHYPVAVTNKINEFETILNAPKVGKSDLQAFTFWGPPGTGKTSIMNKLSAIVTEKVKQKYGKTHHYQINSKDLQQFDWKLDRLTKFVKGEELDNFYELEKNPSRLSKLKNMFSSDNPTFSKNLDAICIQIDEADQMGSANLAKLQSAITQLEESGQKVVIFMTTNNLDKIPSAMHRRIQPLEIGFPNKKQKELILEENIEKLTVNDVFVYDNSDEANKLKEALKEALKKAFQTAGGLADNGIMGDHIVKSLNHAIQISITSEKLGSSNQSSLIGNKILEITKKFQEKMQEFVEGIPVGV